MGPSFENRFRSKSQNQTRRKNRKKTQLDIEHLEDRNLLDAAYAAVDPSFSDFTITDDSFYTPDDSPELNTVIDIYEEPSSTEPVDAPMDYSMDDMLTYEPYIHYPADDVAIMDPIMDYGMDDLIVDDPAMDYTIDDPAIDPAMDYSIDDPAMDYSVEDPVMDYTIDDPVIDYTIDDPAFDPVIDDPAFDPVMDYPIDDPMVEDPVVEDPVVEDPMVDDPVGEPIDDANVGTPRGDYLDNPADDPNMDDPGAGPGNDEPFVGPLEAPDDENSGGDSANEGVVLATNSSLTVNVGKNVTITNTYLQATHPSVASTNIWYEVVELPRHGVLKRNFIPVFLGTKFSQFEIDTGRITYSHDGSAVPVDGFTFNVAAGENGAALRRTFLLTPGGVLPQVTTGHSSGSYTISLAESGALLGMGAVRSDSRFAGVDGSGFASVIIDTGIDVDHSFFGPDTDSNGIADRIVYQYDYFDNDTDASDFNDHGSNVASIVGSSDSVLTGMAPGTDIIAFKISSDSTSPSVDFLAAQSALQWVAANAIAYNIASVNLSIGDSGYYTAPRTDIFSDEFAMLAALDVIVVSASGNGYFGLPGVSYPAADANSLSVGAVWDGDNGGPWGADLTTGADRITAFSQRDPALTDIFAPGALITGAAANGSTVAQGGTSQAAPHVAGIATLAQQFAVQRLGRRLTFAEFRNLIRDTGVTIYDGDDEDDLVPNTNINYKRIDPFALLAMIDRLAPPTLIDDGGVNDTSERATNLGTVSTQMTLAGQSIARHANGTYDHDWYHFTAGQSGALTISLDEIRTSNQGDLHFRVFQVIDGRLVQVTHSNRTGWVGTQSATFNARAGVRYHVWVFGYNFEQGSYDLSIGF